MAAFPEPGATDDVRGLLLDYLDYFRGVVAAKVTGLTAARLRCAPAGAVGLDPCRTAHSSRVHGAVLQEYARHAGHLDIARELADGSTGEEG